MNMRSLSDDPANPNTCDLQALVHCGTFVEKPDGVTLDSLAADHPLVKQLKDKSLSDFFTPEALKDTASGHLRVVKNGEWKNLGKR